MALGQTAAGFAALLCSLSGAWDFGRDLDYWRVVQRPGPEASLSIRWEDMGVGCLVAEFHDPGDFRFEAAMMTGYDAHLILAPNSVLLIDASLEAPEGTPPQPVSFGVRGEDGAWVWAAGAGALVPPNVGRCVKVVRLAGLGDWPLSATGLALRIGRDYPPLAEGRFRIYEIALHTGGAPEYAWTFPRAADGFVAQGGCRVEHVSQDGQGALRVTPTGDGDGKLLLAPGTSVPLTVAPASPPRAVIRARLAPGGIETGHGAPHEGALLAYLRGGGLRRWPFGLARTELEQRVVVDLSERWPGWSQIESIGIAPFAGGTGTAAGTALYLSEIALGRSGADPGLHLWGADDAWPGWSFAPSLAEPHRFLARGAEIRLGRKQAPDGAGPAIWNLALGIDARQADRLFLDYRLEGSPGSEWLLEVRWDHTGRRSLAEPARTYPLPLTGPGGGKSLVNLAGPPSDEGQAYGGVISALHLSVVPGKAAQGELQAFHFGRLALTGGGDMDRDTLSDAEELLTVGTDPQEWDTDGDMLSDGWETRWFLDPLSAKGPDGAEGDPDEDGYANADEQRGGSDPQEHDSTPVL